MLTVGGLTAISRVLGFVRDMIMAWLLGAGLLADAFVVANRIPNILRRFMAEGAVSVAFVPVFSEVKEKEGIERAFLMAREVMTLMFYSLIVVVIIGELPLLHLWRSWLRIHSGGIFDTTVHLTGSCSPIYLIASPSSSWHPQFTGHFAAPAAAPILMNLFMIGVPVLGYVAYPVFSSPADALAWGVIAGGIAQILIQIPPLLKRHVPLGLTKTFNSSRVRQVVRLVGVAAIGASIYQVNVLIGTLLASLLPRGSVAYLYYANRILELPLGIFAFAVGNVMLPAMSAASARLDTGRFSFLMGRGLLTVLLFTIPATAGCLVLAGPIFTVLFLRGAFTYDDALASSYALQMYALSLWGVGYSRIQTQALYAMQKARTVVNISWLTLLANLVFCLILMPLMQHAGIALASSIAVFVQLLIQHVFIKKAGIHIPKEHVRQFGKMVAAAFIMGLALIPLVRLDIWKEGLSLASGSVLLLAITLGGGLYFGCLWAMGIRGFPGKQGHTDQP
jgi:putative peptidoglycan lipid II flippase